MKKFRSRFAALERLYEQARNEAQKRLADARQALAILDQRIAENTQERQTLRGNLHPHLVGMVSVDRLLDQGRYDLQIDVNLRELTVQRGQIEEEIARRQQRLLLAEQEYRKFSKLVEIERTQYDAEVRRLEQAAMDELASIRSTHKELDAP